MECPYCHGDMKVIDTAADDRCIYRTRKCLRCQKRICTQENQMGYYEGRRIINRLRKTKQKKNDEIKEVLMGR